MRPPLAPPWPRRIAVLALGWILTAVVLTWVGSDPSWIGVLAAAGALAGLVWFLVDVGPEHAASGWTIERDKSSERSSLDGRLGMLRRLAEAAGQPQSDGERTRPAAAEVQDILRRAAELRIRSTGAALPTDLTDYLRADPAPLVSSARLDQLLTQIEDL